MARNGLAKRDQGRLTRASARAILNEHIKYGRVARPERCDRCDRTPQRATDGRSLIQAHHADYSRPLDVEWLCTTCHDDEHRPGTATESRSQISLQTRIDAELYRQVNVVAREQGRTRVDFVESALRAYLG